jgi:hypothetical protein
MDINYILGREQISLHNASMAKSGPARLSHQGLADAYGRLLEASGFPHRSALEVHIRPAPADDAVQSEDAGGPAHAP